ncbi:MAG TPA: signal peptidase II, partial [Limnochordales bacterium]
LWVISRLAPGQSRPVLPGLLYLTRLHNPGAAFGLFAYQQELLAAGAVLVLLVAWWRRREIQRLPSGMRFGLALGLGGAVGNLIDRVGRGAVVDFIDILVLPVFNVADTAIVAGVVILIWYVLLGRDAAANPQEGRRGA